MSCWIFEPGLPPIDYPNMEPLAYKFDEGVYKLHNGEWFTIACYAANGNLNNKMWIEVDLIYLPKHVRAAALILE